MSVSPAAFERAIVRSRLRRNVLLMLASLGEAFPRQLAAACRIDASRVQAVMFGRMPDYSEELSLVRLGLAEIRATAHGRVYAITPRGLRKARQLTARTARRERARATRAAQRLHPHPLDATPVPVATPVGATFSVTWPL